MPGGKSGERVQRRRSTWVRAGVLAAVATVAMQLALAGSASAANFANCPAVTEVICVWAETSGRMVGELNVGSGVMPTVLALEGGYQEETGDFYEAEPKGPTLVPFSAKFGELTATVKLNHEVERPFKAPQIAEAVELNPENLLGGEKVALRLSVRIYLENPELPKTCGIGPIVLNLTTGAPGKVGKVEVKTVKGREAVIAKENTLVDNSFAEPGASECGSPTTDAVIDSQLKLPRAAGTNVAIFRDTFELLG